MEVQKTVVGAIERKCSGDAYADVFTGEELAQSGYA